MNPNCLNALKQKRIDNIVLHEKRKSNLFQNRYSGEINKKHETIQHLDTLLEEPIEQENVSIQPDDILNYDIPKMLTQLNDVVNIVDIWKSRSSISKSQTIYACLAVDAVYFTPDIHIDQKSIFNGLIFSENDEKLISKNAFSRFSENPNEFQIFLQLNADKIIKAGFIFHVQPYDPKYDNFIAHIHPAQNGKANESILFKLDEIKRLLKNRNLTILSYSFDGDNAYSVLHKKYFESYYNSAIRNNFISFSKTLQFKVNSDFLHIIKRLRYRLFGGDIHSGFLISNPSFNIQKLQTIFPNIPNVVWNNEPYTKMHDSLPLILFKPENFLHLLLNGFYVEAAYFSPISLTILALNYKNLGYSNRMYLLQVSFWILAYYFDEINHTEIIELGQTKRSGTHLLFYSHGLVIELMNTLHCNMQLMHSLEQYCADRNSTTPLEHKFGCVRRRSKFVHTLHKFLYVVSKMQTEQQKRVLINGENYENEIEKIHNRQNSFGVLFEKKQNSESDIFKESEEQENIYNEKFSPQVIAKAILCKAGFDYSYSSFISEDDAIENLIVFLSNIVDELPSSPKKKKVISNHSITLGVGQCTNGKLLITSTAKKMTVNVPKKHIKRELLDSKIREKFGIENDKEITKKQYWDFIRRIMNKCDISLKIFLNPPTHKCKKEVLINWLIDHLAQIITLIPDI